MPWTPSDGPRRHTKKANTPKKRQVWSKVANAVLKRSGDDGQAIREANAVVSRIKHGKTKKS